MFAMSAWPFTPVRFPKLRTRTLTISSSAEMHASLTYDQRRHLAVREHLHGLATEQKPSDGAAAVRCHYDQITAILLGGRDDAFGGMLAGTWTSSQATPAFFAFCPAASRIDLAEAVAISSN